MSLPATTTAAVEPLTDQQRAVLEIERLHWKYQGVKDDVIRQTLGISATRYYQVLWGMLEASGSLHAAMQYDPQLVGRLQRIRQQRTDQRSADFRLRRSRDAERAGR